MENIDGLIDNLGDYAREQTIDLFENGYIDAHKCAEMILDPRKWNNYYYFPRGGIHNAIIDNLRLIMANYKEFFKAEDMYNDPENWGCSYSNTTHRGNKLIAYDSDDSLTNYIDIFGNLWEREGGIVRIQSHGKC